MIWLVLVPVVGLVALLVVFAHRRGIARGKLLVRAHESSADIIQVAHILGGTTRIAYEGRDAGLAKTAFSVRLADGQSAEYWVGTEIRSVRRGSVSE